MLYRFGIYAFDPARYDLHHAGQPVALRPQACELLAYLLRHRDRVVPKAELLAQVWPGQYVGDGVLHAGVLAVRTALRPSGDRGVCWRVYARPRPSRWPSMPRVS
jgi:DNA-binding winged helix-turn-helix (wHTH) protein